MPDVTDLIQSAAKRRQPTTTDILALASGSGSGTSGSRSSTRATNGKSSSSSPRARASKSAGTSKSSRAKAPCKYGPRGPDGLCPKKPRSANPYRQTSRNRTKVTARTTTSATTQAVDVLTNPKASSDQKAAAVGKVAEVTATEAVKKTVKKAVKSGQLQKLKEPAKKAARTAIGFSLPIAAAVGGGMVTSKLQKGRVEKQAQKMLDDTIRRTPPGQRNQYTPEIKAKLKAQYAAHIRKQNEILFTK